MGTGDHNAIHLQLVHLYMYFHHILFVFHDRRQKMLVSKLLWRKSKDGRKPSVKKSTG